MQQFYVSYAWNCNLNATLWSFLSSTRTEFLYLMMNCLLSKNKKIRLTIFCTILSKIEQLNFLVVKSTSMYKKYEIDKAVVIRIDTWFFTHNTHKVLSFWAALTILCMILCDLNQSIFARSCNSSSVYFTCHVQMKKN